MFLYRIIKRLVMKLMWSSVLVHHQMDYRSLVHEKDEAIYSEIRVIILDIRGFYVSQSDLKWKIFHFLFVPKLKMCFLQAEMYDIINKNLDKVTNPKGEEKSSMYWRRRQIQQSALSVGSWCGRNRVGFIFSYQIEISSWVITLEFYSKSCTKLRL